MIFSARDSGVFSANCKESSARVVLCWKCIEGFDAVIFEEPNIDCSVISILMEELFDSINSQCSFSEVLVTLKQDYIALSKGLGEVESHVSTIELLLHDRAVDGGCLCKARR